MKYLLTAVSATLLLASCSGANSPTAELDEPAEIVVSETDSETTDADDTAADSEEADSEDTDGEEDTDANDSEASDKDDNDTAGLEQKNVKLEVDNQKTSGQVTVKKVATSRDGWISIHKSKEDGSIQQPDSIGEARVDSGDSEDIVVDLWDAPAVGDKLWALLHIDAGERGKYEYPGKDAPVKKNGETMARSFVIQGDEEEEDEASDE